MMLDNIYQSEGRVVSNDEECCLSYAYIGVFSINNENIIS